MAFTLDQSYVKQFSGIIHDLLEQKSSKLLPYVDKVSVTGKEAFFERLGSAGAVEEITSVHADTVLDEMPHSRRMLRIKDYAKAVLLDRQDKIKTLIDPLNPYAKKLAASFGRKIDEVIIDALGGNASAGEDGSTAVALPAGQKVAAGGTGFTFAKLNSVRRIFNENEYDGPLYAVIRPDALENLLTETEVQSFDYNTVKTLVSGEIDTFMGMKFIISNRVDAGVAYVFGEDAVKFGMALDLTVEIDKRADKNNNTQVLAVASFGAVRMEDELVVEVSYV